MDIDRKETKEERRLRHQESRQKAKDWANKRKTRSIRKQVNPSTNREPEEILEAKILSTYPVEAHKESLSEDTVKAIHKVIGQLEQDISRIESVIEVLRERLS